MPLGRFRPVVEVQATPLDWFRSVIEVQATPLGRLWLVMEVRAMPLGRHPPGGSEPHLARPVWLAWRPRRGAASLPVEVPVVLTLIGRARYLALALSP